MEPFEIEQLRRNERFIDKGCRVFDAAAQFFADKPLTKEVQTAAVNEIVARFRGELPDMMIASYVGKQFAVEQRRRADAAATPPPVRRDIFGRPIQERRRA